MNLSHINHWIEIASDVVDVLLLLRVLGLRLYRTYLFITLVCLLEVFFDGIFLYLGATPVSSQVFIYSRFLIALVYPLATWDVFEEIRGQLASLRRAAMQRTITSLLLMTLLGFVLGSFVDTNDQNNTMAFVGTLALVVWTGSAAGSLSFLWVVHRALRAQKIPPTPNTLTWLHFYELFLGGEVAACFYQLLAGLMPAWSDGLFFCLGIYGTLITVWCAWKLRSAPSDAAPTPVSANS